MKHARRTDFWFAGVAILPVVFLFAGRPEAILMLYAPLLIVACLFGMYEQKMAQAEQPPPEPEKPASLSNAVPGDDATASLDSRETVA
jgi:hypothetical protein